MKSYFEYGNQELSHLRKVDKRMAEIIDKVGFIKRETTPDLFSALINSIVGQQISTKAHATIWLRIIAGFGEITPQKIAEIPAEELQSYGLSFRKVGYMQATAHKVLSGELNINSLYSMSDDEVVVELSKLSGIGVWTAEMLMLFSMQRPNILSYEDLAIIRGLRMVYRHRTITKEIYLKYFKRHSPYNSVASLYFWAVAGGAIDGLTDPAPKTKSKK